jgi:hypothetical protein
MYLHLLESAVVWLFRVTEAYSSFDRIRAIYRTLRLSKGEKLFVMNERVLEAIVPEKIYNSYRDENTVYWQA